MSRNKRLEEGVRVRRGILRSSESQIKKSSGASALTPDAAAQLGPKAVELQKKKAKQVDVPSFLNKKKGIGEEIELDERTMTSIETKKEKSLKKKYDDSGMKKSMIDQYGQEKGRQVYFAYIRKKAMNEGFIDPEEEIPTSSGRPGRKPIENVASHPNPKVRRKAVANMRKQMEKEYGGKWKTKGKDPAIDENFDYAEIYNYILESLVECDYAEDYDSAEIMFEHISTDFTSLLLGKYLEEKARGTRKKSTVHAYDVDETLFGHGKKGKPNVQVHVNDKSGKRVKSLSNQEFNTHKLEPGHSYDFSEFQSAKKFRETSSPNKRVIKDVKRKQARGQNVHLITARSKFDNPSEFQGHLKQHGVNVDKSKIHYTGGMKGGDIGKKKVDVASAVAKQSGAKGMHMYDDAAKVHKAFEKEKGSSPMKIKTHMVAPDKSGESRVRSYQATKGGQTGGQEKTIKQNQRARKRARRGMSEEMTTYDYWKQFID